MKRAILLAVAVCLSGCREDRETAALMRMCDVFAPAPPPPQEQLGAHSEHRLDVTVMPDGRRLCRIS